MQEKYSAVMGLGSHSDVTLLRDTQSGKLVVRRIVDSNQADIYKILQNNNINHIPKIYSINELENNKREIIEEYIVGRTLEEILQNEITLSENNAVSYAVQLCEMLAPLHRKGIIHRDIKPSNIIITDENYLYLIDFDISRLHKSKSGTDTEFLGTQGYAAPEQFGFNQTNGQTDIYSIGVLLNIMLTGNLPQNKMAKGTLSHIIKRCTQMEPSKRYRNVKALERALRPYLPMGNPKALNVLRKIPGFRTFTPWKMTIAVIAYAFVLLCVIIMIPEMMTWEIEITVCVVLSCMYYIFALAFIFDFFNIRSSIKWLEKSRGELKYLLKCILILLVTMIVISYICMLVTYQKL